MRSIVPTARPAIVDVVRDESGAVCIYTMNVPGRRRTLRHPHVLSACLRRLFRNGFLSRSNGSTVGFFQGLTVLLSFALNFVSPELVLMLAVSVPRSNLGL